MQIFTGINTTPNIIWNITFLKIITIRENSSNTALSYVKVRTRQKCYYVPYKNDIDERQQKWFLACKKYTSGVTK